MLKKSLALCLLLVAAQTYAASDSLHITLGGAIKNSSRMNTAPDRSRVDILVEGAGVIKASGKTVHFYALCDVVDMLAGTKQVDGASNCELRSTAGGVAYVHYRGDTEHADRGQLSIDGGTGDFAGISGSVAVEASVNPVKVEKPVFLLEDLVDSGAQQ